MPVTSFKLVTSTLHQSEVFFFSTRVAKPKGGYICFTQFIILKVFAFMHLPPFITKLRPCDFGVYPSLGGRAETCQFTAHVQATGKMW